jgi:release factor glutamine methyltransferase
MYLPAEDTYLLAECALLYRGRWALEIGVGGSGAVANALSRNFENVAGSDIDFAAARGCKAQNPALMVACCDAASAFRGQFDLVVSNPPYLPDDDDDGGLKRDRTVHGGPAGVEATIHFIESALPLLGRNGRMLVVASSLADTEPLDAFLLEKRLKKKVIKEKALFFERLYVLEITF